MRRGTSDKAVITSEIVETAGGGKSGGQVIGINLGWDFCAEHEQGLKGLKYSFGIPERAMRRRDVRRLVQENLVGANARTVTKVPRELQLLELGDYAYLIFADLHWMKKEDLTEKFLNDILEAYGDEELATAWSEGVDGSGQFGVRMKNDAFNLGTMVLGQIYEAFKRRDVMIFSMGTGSNNPFARPGLVIAIRSRVPEEWLTKMKESDEDYLNLTEAAEKTGIEAKLKAAGKRYFALSPRWASSIKSTSDGEVKSQHSVIFWLNPHERENNFGWYTVEQLMDWIDGKGPIPKVRTTA